jgi:hypothetical protein
MFLLHDSRHKHQLGTTRQVVDKAPPAPWPHLYAWRWLRQEALGAQDQCKCCDCLAKTLQQMQGGGGRPCSRCMQAESMTLLQPNPGPLPALLPDAYRLVTEEAPTHNGQLRGWLQTKFTCGLCRQQYQGQHVSPFLAQPERSQDQGSSTSSSVPQSYHVGIYIQAPRGLKAFDEGVLSGWCWLMTCCGAALGWGQAPLPVNHPAHGCPLVWEQSQVEGGCCI